MPIVSNTPTIQQLHNHILTKLNTTTTSPTNTTLNTTTPTASPPTSPSQIIPDILGGPPTHNMDPITKYTVIGICSLAGLLILIGGLMKLGMTLHHAYKFRRGSKARLRADSEDLEMSRRNNEVYQTQVWQTEVYKTQAEREKVMRREKKEREKVERERRREVRREEERERRCKRPVQMGEVGMYQLGRPIEEKEMKVEVNEKQEDVRGLIDRVKSDRVVRETLSVSEAREAWRREREAEVQSKVARGLMRQVQ